MKRKTAIKRSNTLQLPTINEPRPHSRSPKRSQSPAFPRSRSKSSTRSASSRTASKSIPKRLLDDEKLVLELIENFASLNPVSVSDDDDQEFFDAHDDEEAYRQYLLKSMATPRNTLKKPTLRSKGTSRRPTVVINEEEDEDISYQKYLKKQNQSKIPPRSSSFRGAPTRQISKRKHSPERLTRTISRVPTISREGSIQRRMTRSATLQRSPMRRSTTTNKIAVTLPPHLAKRIKDLDVKTQIIDQDSDDEFFDSMDWMEEEDNLAVPEKDCIVMVPRSFYEYLASRAGESLSLLGSAAKVASAPAALYSSEVAGVLGASGALLSAAGNMAVNRFGRKSTKRRALANRAEIERFLPSAIVETVAGKGKYQNAIGAAIEGGIVVGGISLVAGTSLEALDPKIRARILKSRWARGAGEAADLLGGVSGFLPEGIQKFSDVVSAITQNVALDDGDESWEDVNDTVEPADIMALQDSMKMAQIMDFQKFLLSQSCYDILPQSSRIIVFDKQLLVKKALSALLQHSLHSAPLWNSQSQEFIGMLTVTDFIQLILYYYSSNTHSDDISTLKLSRLKEIVKTQTAIKLNPMDSLFNAAKTLLENRLHRLPLIDTCPDGQDMIIAVMTQYKILRYLATTCPESKALDFAPQSRGIGTFTKIATITPATLLIDLLYLFIKNRISALPVLDDTGKLLTCVEKYDILNLAREGHKYDLALPVGEALKSAAFNDYQGIHVCSVDDTVGAMMQTISKVRVRRFIVVKDEKLVGVVSLSDLLRYFCSKRDF